jgi:hypothetical protein
MPDNNQDELREKLCSLMIEDDFPILNRSDQEKLDGIIALFQSDQAKHYQAIKSGRPEQKYPDDGNGDEDNQNLGWNNCRTAYDAVVDEVFKGDI